MEKSHSTGIMNSDGDTPAQQSSIISTRRVSTQQLNTAPHSGKAALIERIGSRRGIHTAGSACAQGVGLRNCTLVALDGGPPCRPVRRRTPDTARAPFRAHSVRRKRLFVLFFYPAHRAVPFFGMDRPSMSVPSRRSRPIFFSMPPA